MQSATSRLTASLVPPFGVLSNMQKAGFDFRRNRCIDPKTKDAIWIVMNGIYPIGEGVNTVAS